MFCPNVVKLRTQEKVVQKKVAAMLHYSFVHSINDSPCLRKILTKLPSRMDRGFIGMSPYHFKTKIKASLFSRSCHVLSAVSNVQIIWNGCLYLRQKQTFFVNCLVEIKNVKMIETSASNMFTEKKNFFIPFIR